MPTIRLRSPDGTTIREVPQASAEYALRDGWKPLPQVHVRLVDGRHVVLDEDLAEQAVSGGAWRMTADEVQAESVLIQRAAAEAHERRVLDRDGMAKWYIATWSAMAVGLAIYGQFIATGDERRDVHDICLIVALFFAFIAVAQLTIRGRRER